MNEKIQEVDHLVLALTRSPVCMGVNLRLFFANCVLSTLLCIDLHTFLGIPLFIFLHAVMARLSIKDPNFFTVYTKSFLKTTPTLNYSFWGTINTYQPW